jgi:hypothetical protein
MITLESIDGCSIGWQLIMGVLKATVFNYVADASLGVRTRHHNNLGFKKPRFHTLQTIATPRCFLEKSIDHMPNRSTTLSTKEVVVTKTLYSSFN